MTHPNIGIAAVVRHHRAHDPSRAVHQPGGGVVRRGRRAVRQVRQEGPRDHRLPVVRRHVLQLFPRNQQASDESPLESGDSPLFGHGPDFGYLYFGVPWYGDEIWNSGRMKDYDKDGRVDEIETLRWNDENRAGKGDFLPWLKYAHPQCGEVEIGGWNPKFWSQNPPAEMIETWAKNEAMFNLYLAQQLPQVRVARVDVQPVKGAEGSLRSARRSPTKGGCRRALEIAKRVKIVRPDTVAITLGRGPDHRAARPPKPKTKKPAKVKPARRRPLRPVGQPRRRHRLAQSRRDEDRRWLVKGTGKVTVTVGSTRGGVHAKDGVAIGQAHTP